MAKKRETKPKPETGGGLMPYADPEKLTKATARRDEADYQCFMTGRELLRYEDELRKVFERYDDVQVFLDFVAAIEERNEANEEVMQALVANR